MATYTKRNQWRGWSGTIEDLESGAGLAQQGIREWTDEEDMVISVRVVLKDFTLRGETIETLREVRLPDLRRIRSIDIDIGRRLSVEPRIAIDISHESPAMTLEVSGQDRTRVEGLHAQLKSRLEEGARRPGWWARWLVSLLYWTVPLLALGLEALVRVAGLASVNGKWDPAELVALFGGGSLYLAFLIGLWWLTPDLQLLAPGERTRGRRFRAVVWFFVVGVLASLVASIVLLVTSR